MAALSNKLKAPKKKKCLNESTIINDKSLNHHDYVPKETFGKIWVVMTKKPKIKSIKMNPNYYSDRRKVHFPCDWKYDPQHGDDSSTKEYAQCFKKRRIAERDIKWMTLGHAIQTLTIRSEWGDNLCLSCTPEWIRSNWDFATKCGFTRGWIRWCRRGSTDNIYHADACSTLHETDRHFNVVRVKEEVVFKDGSTWKPCLNCHKRIQTAQNVS
jgi:hypothetical protein